MKQLRKTNKTKFFTCIRMCTNIMFRKKKDELQAGSYILKGWFARWNAINLKKIRKYLNNNETITKKH